MTRHSFVQISKLTDIKGRIDYIGTPKRQEHLYAFYSTVEPEFWHYLSDQAQNDFWKSHQKNGKCVEARELIIALPESLRAHDPKLLLQLFTEQFREKYGVQCAASLHHNKAMTNYHIHLVFADRDVLEKTEVKKAARNMFFDESGGRARRRLRISAVQDRHCRGQRPVPHPAPHHPYDGGPDGAPGGRDRVRYKNTQIDTI